MPEGTGGVDGFGPQGGEGPFSAFFVIVGEPPYRFGMP
jgi:hypothetical protein